MALRQALCAFAIFSAVCRAADCTAKRPLAVAALLNPMIKTFAFTMTGSVMASPATITFTSPDPDTTPTNGNTTATISWGMSGVSSWSLSVNAAAASFTGCPLVPRSAVQFQCTSATPALLGNASCSAGTFTLSSSPQTIASGTVQGTGTATVIVAFKFTDAWKYPANSSCSLNLTYTATGI
jgi:hypothetical protein